MLHSYNNQIFMFIHSFLLFQEITLLINNIRLNKEQVHNEFLKQTCLEIQLASFIFSCTDDSLPFRQHVSPYCRFLHKHSTPEIKMQEKKNPAAGLYVTQIKMSAM